MHCVTSILKEVDIVIDTVFGIVFLGFFWGGVAAIGVKTYRKYTK